MPGYVYKQTGSRPVCGQRYRCPDCDGEFTHFWLSSESRYPDRCPICNAWVSTEAPPEEVFVAQSPGIRENAYAKSVDQVYRAQEQASIDRADEAGEHLESVYRAQGKVEGPEADLVAYHQKLELAGLKSGLKITDMKDPSSMREGDLAAVAPTPAGLASAGGRAQFQNLGGAVPNHAPDIPLTGEATRQLLAADHGQRAATMAARGQMRPAYVDKP